MRKIRDVLRLSHETDQAVNTALQLCCVEGVEIAVVHHPEWSVAGAGSVVTLWGDPGDLVVEFAHLKKRDEMVGPFKVQHDHVRGVSVAIDRVEAFGLLGARSARPSQPSRDGRGGHGHEMA
jgi:replicative DNA helicase